MKRLLLLLFLAILAFNSHAQYRTYKKQYDVKGYKYQDGDRYNVAGPAFVSFIVPGLGHVLVGEPLRGLGFYGLTYGSLATAMLGGSMMNENSNQTVADILAIGGLSLFVGSYVWCISDVIKVAKIKNMRIRDQHLALHLYPSFQSTPNENFRLTNASGITMTVNF